ncbi:hypothetical protein PMA3_20625 [Pseudomonas silesiensis]|uniref:Plasmid replication protein RepL domain-containing protein n=1 Tax=Pseudomonas silesiensis TaxID=1853130 RepID=A0A191YX20_9PSED|nr:hypothetical protein [Pseudomonas silesiensis]ANJ57432.1 hypothetical protein PMA3_20625 [Pseudomonas silesiensis]
MNTAANSTKTDALISVDGLILDKHTGEIHGHDGKLSPWSGRYDYMLELGKCRSVDDFQYHLGFVDRRKLPAHELHTLRDEVDHAFGKWRRTGIDCRITLPQQRLLEKLHGLVLYRNVIIMIQADLAVSLCTVESNLMKKLRVLIDANMLRVSTSRNSNIRTGEIKLVVNPRMVFRGDDYRRRKYIEEWYRPVGCLHTGVFHPGNADECLAMVA